MIDAALEALTFIFTFERLAWMTLGVLIGLFLGVVPGIGGAVGMSLLIPVVYGMDPYSGIALMIGMIAVMQTGDTFTAVLIGVPGSAGGQATIMDGYPMARRGEAGRALGAAFLASMLGGILGAIFLFAIIPLARPIILSFASPELFMMAIIGLSLVALLSKGAPLKGALAGVLGMLISTVGLAPSTADLRFTFDSPYLYSGVGLILVALGVFAIPELVELMVENKRIARDGAKVTAGIGQGMRDTIRNWRLVIQGSAIGSFLGMIPGIAGPVINWLCYGAASSTVRKDNRFGQGDVRGVIGPEAGNNATEGGHLVPVLMFGIPAGATSAILLGGLALMGVNAGPSMVEDENLPITLSIVWTLAIANVLGTALCILLATPISKIAFIPARRAAPFLIAVVLLAAFQSTRQWGDLLVVMGLGLIAFVMKQLQWPRVPLLVGFVLGPAAERYFTISTSVYGWDWIFRPGVLMMLTLLVGGIVYSALRKSRRSRLREINQVELGEATVDPDTGRRSIVNLARSARANYSRDRRLDPKLDRRLESDEKRDDLDEPR